MVRARKNTPAIGVGTATRAPEKDIPTGRPYGARAEAQTAIAALPLAGGSVPPVESAGPAAAPTAAPAGSTAAPNDAALLQAAQQYQMSGSGLTDPSANLNEPVTAGLATGPGVGPGALNMPDPTQQDLQTWRQYLPTLEYMASLPSSTASTRNFVRRLRSTMPPSAP